MRNYYFEYGLYFKQDPDTCQITDSQSNVQLSQ